MAGKIPETYEDILYKKSFAHLATTMEDGTPQVSPVWIDYDGEHILINSARGRLKDLNMRRNPYVALSVTDPDDPYHRLLVRGPVVEITTDGADAHIDKLAKKYRGVDKYDGGKPGEVRVLYRIEPEHVTGQG